MGLPFTGTKAVFKERLRGALETEDETNAESLTNELIDAIKKTELQRRLEELSLKTTGYKKDLQNRLKAALEISENYEETGEREESVNGDSNY